MRNNRPNLGKSQLNQVVFKEPLKFRLKGKQYQLQVLLSRYMLGYLHYKADRPQLSQEMTSKLEDQKKLRWYFGH